MATTPTPTPAPAPKPAETSTGAVDAPPGKDGYQGAGANQADAKVPTYEPGTNPPGTNPPVPTPSAATTPLPGQIPGEVAGAKKDTPA